VSVAAAGWVALAATHDGRVWQWSQRGVRGLVVRPHALAGLPGTGAFSPGVTRRVELGDAKSSLGDAKSSLGGAKSSLGGAKSSLGDAESSLGD
jgi:hypothetical protein